MIWYTGCLREYLGGAPNPDLGGVREGSPRNSGNIRIEG